MMVTDVTLKRAELPDPARCLTPLTTDVAFLVETDLRRLREALEQLRTTLDQVVNNYANSFLPSLLACFLF